MNPPGSSDNGRPCAEPGPEAGPACAEDLATLRTLRHFHLDCTAAEAVQVDPPEGFLPCALQPYRDQTLLRGEYPLLLMDRGERATVPLTDYLAAAVPATARLLQDNLLRLERQVQSLLPGDSAKAYRAAQETLATAAIALQKELQLPAEQAGSLQTELDALTTGLPAEATLLGFCKQAPLLLMLAALRRADASQHKAWRQRIADLSQSLKAILDIEAGKGPEAQGAAKLSLQMGSTGTAFVDPQALADVLGEHRGSELMSKHRHRRIRAAHAALRDALETRAGPLLTVLRRAGDHASAGICAHLPPDVEVLETSDPLAELRTRFDQQARQCAQVFRAMRIAKLELEGRYDPSLHDSWLDRFSWTSFSKEELLAMPVLLAIDSAQQLCSEMAALSQLLLSARPVHIMALVEPGAQYGLESPDTCEAHRLELAYLGIAHRCAYVHQGTAAKPTMLARCFAGALGSSRTALHVIPSVADSEAGRLHPILEAGAAVEGRAHPLLCYDPEAGTTWKAQLCFAGNPQPAKDWPLAKAVQTPADDECSPAEQPFTYADFALLDPDSRAEYALIPEGFEHRALIPLADYLQLDEDQTPSKIPFTFATGADGHACRLAISRRLGQAAKQRLGYWQNLQELAGIHNEHARLAAAAAREAAEQAATLEQERMQASHATEIASLRERAAQESMENLARVLVDADIESFDRLQPLPAHAPTGPVTPAQAEQPPPPSQATETESQPEPEVAEVEPSFDEPWVDTPLCTSCDDCIVVNPKVFVYDTNKQVQIGDASAGTFAQIVQAAEKCPASCIHPGLPLDPSEACPEELLQRAAEFN